MFSYNIRTLIFYWISLLVIVVYAAEPKLCHSELLQKLYLNETNSPYIIEVIQRYCNKNAKISTFSTVTNSSVDNAVTNESRKSQMYRHKRDNKWAQWMRNFKISSASASPANKINTYEITTPKESLRLQDHSYYSGRYFKECPKNFTGQLSYYSLDCKSFLNCWRGSGYVQQCSPGTLFNRNELKCDFERKVNCEAILTDIIRNDSINPRHFKYNNNMPNTSTTNKTASSLMCRPGIYGLQPHPTNCSQFYVCANGRAQIHRCGYGMAFNIPRAVCDYEDKVDCSDRNKSMDLTNNNQYQIQNEHEVPLIKNRHSKQWRLFNNTNTTHSAFNYNPLHKKTNQSQKYGIKGQKASNSFTKLDETTTDNVDSVEIPNMYSAVLAPNIKNFSFNYNPLDIKSNQNQNYGIKDQSTSNSFTKIYKTTTDNVDSSEIPKMFSASLAPLLPINNNNNALKNTFTETSTMNTNHHTDTSYFLPHERNEDTIRTYSHSSRNPKILEASKIYSTPLAPIRNVTQIEIPATYLSTNPIREEINNNLRNFSLQTHANSLEKVETEKTGKFSYTDTFAITPEPLVNTTDSIAYPTGKNTIPKSYNSDLSSKTIPDVEAIDQTLLKDALSMLLHPYGKNKHQANQMNTKQILNDMKNSKIIDANNTSFIMPMKQREENKLEDKIPLNQNQNSSVCGPGCYNLNPQQYEKHSNENDDYVPTFDLRSNFLNKNNRKQLREIVKQEYTPSENVLEYLNDKNKMNNTRKTNLNNTFTNNYNTTLFNDANLDPKQNNTIATKQLNTNSGKVVVNEVHVKNILTPDEPNTSLFADLDFNSQQKETKTKQPAEIFMSPEPLIEESFTTSFDDINLLTNDLSSTNHEKGAQSSNLDFEIRIVDGHNQKEGRIKVKVQDKWGYVCHDSFNKHAADVACQELGFRMGASEIRESSFIIHSDEFRPVSFSPNQLHCLGYEQKLRNCNFTGWTEQTCKNNKVVEIVCDDRSQLKCPTNYWLCKGSNECIPMPFVCDNVPDCADQSDEDINVCNVISYRLMDGKNRTEGRLEVLYHGEWGTICDDDFTLKEARVACKSLGFFGEPVIENSFGDGNGLIWMSQISCIGNERTLDECTHYDWGQHDCLHSEDVGLKCK